MFLEQYIERFTHPLYPTPLALDVSGTLAGTFVRLRDTAEAQGVEYGCNLFYLAGSIDVDHGRRGDQTATDLDSARQKGHPGFCGDFHVHPYARKMSETVSIGFSTTDVVDNVENVTSTFMIRFHFVAAGPRLWLIVMYPFSKSTVGGPLTTDITVARDFLSKPPQRNQIWRDGINNRNLAPNVEDKIKSERAMWDQIPEYPAVFADANLAMNQQLAANQAYGLYIGKFGTQSGGDVGIRMIKKGGM
jgi:hypothetical protein